MAVSTDENGSIRRALGRLLSAPASVLWIGFTGLLLLMAVIAVDATISLRDVEVTTAALRTESRSRDGLLDQLRTDIHGSATVVRDYLLEPDDARAESQKAELELLRTRIDDTLRVYEQKLPDTEKDGFEDLRSRIESYWKSLAPALQWDTRARRAKGGRFLQDVIMPVRAEVFQLTRQVTALNERDLDAGEEGIRAVQSRLRRRVVVTSVFALVLGLILGAFSIRRVQRLEREAMARYEEVEEAHRELQKLSDRLVTAQEEERRNLSRELHDEIGQGMSAMLVELGRVEAAPDSETRGERLTSVRRMAEATVGMVRNMALLLRPSMLDDLGLVAALRWQAREVARRSGLNVKMVADEIAEDLPDSHRTCVYRVVQEALNNCARHSQATQVRVVVHKDREGLSVTVQDDGIGFEPSREKGMGLLGMEERVERLGGLFSIESKPGAGTILSIYFPLAGGGPASLKGIV
jgi:signal transduction histidine kinase